MFNRLSTAVNVLLFGLALAGSALKADVITVFDGLGATGSPRLHGSPFDADLDAPPGMVLGQDYDFRFAIGEPNTNPPMIGDIIHILGLANSTSVIISYENRENAQLPCVDGVVFFGCRLIEDGSVQFLKDITWLGDSSLTVVDTVNFVGQLDAADGPEPAAMLLSSLGLIGIGLLRYQYRRRRISP